MAHIIVVVCFPRTSCVLDAVFCDLVYKKNRSSSKHPLAFGGANPRDGSVTDLDPVLVQKSWRDENSFAVEPFLDLRTPRRET